MSDDRAADARAEEEEAKNARAAALLGYTVGIADVWTDEDWLCSDTPTERNVVAIIDPYFKHGSLTPPARPLPAFGTDPAAARLLLEALKPEQRGAVVKRVLALVGSDADQITGGLWEIYADDLFALLLAPPAAIRDAVLEVMEAP